MGTINAGWTHRIRLGLWQLERYRLGSEYVGQCGAAPARNPNAERVQVSLRRPRLLGQTHLLDPVLAMVVKAIVSWCLWQIGVLQRLVAWLDPAPLEAARVLTKAAQQHAMSGEAKRHQVYAALIKAFPNASKRILSQAIEDAVAELP